MLKQSVTQKDMVDLLNSLMVLDADAVTALLGARVRCNTDMANHPTVQVIGPPHPCLEPGMEYAVGFLGILNGAFGIVEDGPLKGNGAFIAHTDDATGKVLRFGLTEES